MDKIAVTVVFMCLLPLMTTSTNISVNCEHTLHEVEPYYLSYCIDQYLLATTPKWLNFKFDSPRLQALMSQLAPSLLRFGGSPADWTVFGDDVSLSKVLNNTGIQPPVSVFTKQDVANMIKLTKVTGNRFLMDLDLQLRYGKQWDPVNAYQFMQFLKDNNFGDNVDFELGNEPVYYDDKGQTEPTPDQVARDFLMLSQLVESFPNLQQSNIVGPDVTGVQTERGYQFINRVADKAGGHLKAITVHQYYFRGDIAHVKDYMNPDYYVDLATVIERAQSAISNSSHPHLPLWIGETADSWHSGTPNVTDRFVSGFLWLDKLGLAASLGVSCVMRQTLYGHNYGLLDLDLNPNPDYWLSWVFKQLVGSKVLQLTYSSSRNTTRVYAHCTNTARTAYPLGSLTMFALNVNVLDDLLMFDEPWKKQSVDVFTLTPPKGDKDAILSKFMALNGQVLEITKETVFPRLVPVKMSVAGGLTLPPLSMMFIVFPQANLTICSADK